MKEHTYYWTCPYCGANLDPGEKCDCPMSLGIDVDYPDVKPSISNKVKGGEKDERTSVDGR